MSKQVRPSSMSGNKRAASPTNAVTEAPAQRMRLAGASAADPPAAVRPPLSAAQRCAADTLALVFGFVEMQELARAARTCKAWLAAAAKDQPRGLRRLFGQADRLAALCASSTPFKKHISRVVCCRGSSSSLSIAQLSQLRQLPELTALEVQPNVADLNRLVNEEGGGALAQLQAAFPPKLRDLSLQLSTAHSTNARQMLLAALPVMKELEQLVLTPAAISVVPVHYPALSLEPLLQLPRLTHLTLNIGDLTVPQLLTIKQISTLRFCDPRLANWSAAQLSALCRPPHRLQQLQELKLYGTTVDEAVMEELVWLPALTELDLDMFTSGGAFAFLPRFSGLQRLSVSLRSGNDAPQQAEHNALLVSALTACPTLNSLTIMEQDCTESCGVQLMQAVPRLRILAFDFCSLPSLRFLRHAPSLKELSLLECKDVRSGHVTGMGSFAPQLERLTMKQCAGLHLDEAEEQLLTPPGALGLPHLREFDYRPAPVESDSDDE